MQAGAVHALERRGLDLPELPRVGDRPAARACRRRRSSRGGAATPPAGGTRPTTTSRRSASRSGRRCRTPPGSPGASGCRARARARSSFFGDGATSEGAFHEGANFAAVMRAPVVLFCNNNGWAISTPVSAQTRAEALVDKAAGYGMPGHPRRRRRRARGATRRRARRSRGPAPARGRPSSRPCRTAPRRTRPPTTRAPTSTRAGRGGASSASASAASRATSAARACSRDELARVDPRRGGRADARGDRARPRPSRSRTSALLFDNAYADPPRLVRRGLEELRRILGDG